jgi:hypothetical protein
MLVKNAEAIMVKCNLMRNLVLARRLVAVSPACWQSQRSTHRLINADKEPQTG